MPEKESVKDPYSVLTYLRKYKKSVHLANSHFLRDEVKIFKLNFLSSLLPKCAYQRITFNLNVNKMGVIADSNRRRVLLWTTVTLIRIF